MQSPSLATVDGGLLASLITAASAAAERYCGREFTSVLRTEIYDGDGSPYLMLRAFPLGVAGVAAITVTAEDGTTDTIAIADLLLNLGNGVIKIKAGAPNSDVSYFPSGFQNISVPYTAGYVTIPADVQQAVVQIAEGMLSANERAGDVTSEKIGDYAVSYGVGGSSLPPAAQALLARYRDIRV